jgi:hypothetical protein
MCIANKSSKGWSIDELDDAGNTSTLLASTRQQLNDNHRVIIGFDFPIGFPETFGLRTGFSGFLDALPNLGRGNWSNFFTKTDDASLVCIQRPFYPRTGKPAGSTSAEKQEKALGIPRSQLFRRCELQTYNRTKASPLFWTIGAKQVGTAAMSGWQEILKPLLDDKQRKFKIWPFEGSLESILKSDCDIVVETYPGEAYNHIDFPKHWKGKRNQSDRKDRAVDILGWMERNGVTAAGPIRSRIEDGFGAGSKGEDPFDAVVGICSMISVVEGKRSEGPKNFRASEALTTYEGWIFGQTDTPWSAFR